MRKSTSRWLRRLALLGLGGFALIGLDLWATFPDVAALATSNPASTALIDLRARQAARGGRATARRWTWVPLARISAHLQRAVIASEDVSFYRHHGFDFEGLQAAVERNLESGDVTHGGSTITQQLAKNLYLSPERTLWRKANEALITRSLEAHLDKRRILELYLNVVEWGDGVYGAEAAARHHFGKSAKDLSREEAALLAAILPAPRRYDPIQLTPYLTKRRDQILKWTR